MATSCIGSIAALSIGSMARRAAPIVIGVVPKKFEKWRRSCVPETVGENSDRKVCSEPPPLVSVGKAFSGDAPQLTTHLFETAGVVGARGAVVMMPWVPPLQPMIKTMRREKPRQKTLSRRRATEQICCNIHV